MFGLLSWIPKFVGLNLEGIPYIYVIILGSGFPSVLGHLESSYGEKLLGSSLHTDQDT